MSTNPYGVMPRDRIIEKNKLIIGENRISTNHNIRLIHYNSNIFNPLAYNVSLGRALATFVAIRLANKEVPFRTWFFAHAFLSAFNFRLIVILGYYFIPK